MPGQATQPTTLRGAVECLSNIDFASAVLDTKEPIHDLIPWDALEQAVKAQDALVAALDDLIGVNAWLTGAISKGVHVTNDALVLVEDELEKARAALEAAVDATEPTFDMNQQAEKLVDEEGNVRLGIVDSEGNEYVIRAMTEEERSAN